MDKYLTRRYVPDNYLIEKAFLFIIILAMTQVKHFLKTKFACCPRECIECLKKLFTLRAIAGGEKNRAENDKKKVTQMRKVIRKD